MILVLDFDGVVQLGHAEGGRWDKHLERDLGIAPETLQQQFFKPYWRAVMLGRRDLFEALRGCWPKLNCRVGPQEFVEYWFSRDCTLDPAVLGVVKEWRKSSRKCVLATNQEHYRAGYLWNDRGLSRYFDAMHYSAELGAQKPEVDFFRLVQERLGMDSGNGIVFFDDMRANVDAAAQFGWQAHHYRAVDDLKRATGAA